MRRDGRPQLSDVMHHVAGDGTIRVSTTASRAKVRNVPREPWVALHVNGETFFTYAVLEGDPTLSDVATRPGDVAGALVDLYRPLLRARRLVGRDGRGPAHPCPHGITHRHAPHADRLPGLQSGQTRQHDSAAEPPRLPTEPRHITARATAFDAELIRGLGPAWEVEHGGSASVRQVRCVPR
ncbi:hypothetical protein [Occultella aeris]|uniref:hypothetical protein n=1 Tax=Occultella aeris TaxID=2761496 RepID=UPI0012EAC73D